MAKKPKKEKIERPAIAQGLVLFLRRRALAVCIAAIAIGAARIAATYSEMSITFDEPAHLACGMQYVADHAYRYEPQHPPLARAMCAVGPYLSGIRPGRQANMWVEGVAEFYQDGRTSETLALARLGILPFFVLACLTIFWWGRRHFDDATAAVAVVLFTLMPPVLAHAGLATTDMALAACLTAAFFRLMVWAEEPSWRNSAVLGVAAAAAPLSKFSAIGFFPAAAVFSAAAYLLIARPSAAEMGSMLRRRAAPFALAVLVGAAVIWVVYFFSFGPFFEGIARVLKHNRSEGGGYLFGKLYYDGRWYFFPVMLSLKTPVAFLLLLAAGVWLVLRKPWNIHRWLPLALVLGLLVPAATSTINYGIRHVLPVYAGFALLAAPAVVWLLEQSKTRWVLAALMLWMAFSSARQHPDYLAYGNELVGSQPENVMVDSDLDWGQETTRLARRLRELRAPSVAYFTMNLDDAHLRIWPGLPPVTPIHPLNPSEGWTAVSPTFWKVGQYGLEHRYPGVEPWFTSIQPVERVGSLLLYYVPPGTLRQKP